MYNSVINLITKTASTATDEYGNVVYTQSTSQVFAKVASIGMKEFYQAQAEGLKPEIKFILADYYDYGDQTTVEYEGKTYRVLRTFRDGQTLELVCYKEVNES